MNNFTILLILKDRPEYTKRLMSYWDHINFSYPIIIADGGRDREIQNKLQNKQNFPNLNYEYIRCPYDQTLDHFYEKMVTAVQQINTPVVAAMDNDDFIFSDSIERCLKVLKENDNFSSARGAINPINFSHNTYGHITTLGPNIYTKYPDSIIEQSAAGRVVEQTKRFHSNWHNITRSNHFKTAWEMINVVKPQNFRFTEQVICYLYTVWGDSFRSNSPWILHQQGERIEVDGKSLASHFPDQATWINSDYWLEEFNKMTEVVAVAISDHDGMSIEESLDIFAKTYPLKLPHLKDLLQKRIQEAVKLGYNEGRIEELFKIIRGSNIKEVEMIGELNLNVLPSTEEIKVLTHFFEP